MRDNKISITIAISTYNRPDGLQKVLSGIADIEIPEQVSPRVVVADNSVDANAEAQVEQVAKSYPWPLIYHHVPERGVVYPRNRSLKDALDNDSNYLVYIDDDEFPHKKWLHYLLKSIQESGVAAVSGGVLPVFDKKPAWWIEREGYFKIINFPVKTPIKYAHTGNVIIDTQVIRDLKLSFNPDFSLTGGEDALFFKTIRDAGYQTFFCKQALIYEDIHEERATLLWLLKRWYRIGNTHGLIYSKDRVSSAKILLGGLVRTGFGATMAFVSLPLLVFGNSLVFNNIRIMMRGIGFISAVFGYRFYEYRDHKR